MHILLTRPEPDAAACRAQLEALGHRVTAEPLLTVETLPLPETAFDGAAGVVVTSRNGLRALAASPEIEKARPLPLLAVGPGTGDLAKQLGFADVTASTGTGEALFPTVVERAGGAAGPYVFVRGEDVAFDLAKACEQQGVVLRSIIAYRAQPASCLSPETAELIASGELDAVILMSPRTGRIFVRLASEAGLVKECANLVFCSLSRNVAATLEPLGASRVEIAETPNSSAMLTTVTRVATLWSGV